MCVGVFVWISICVSVIATCRQLYCNVCVCSDLLKHPHMYFSENEQQRDAVGPVARPVRGATGIYCAGQVSREDEMSRRNGATTLLPAPDRVQ